MGSLGGAVALSGGRSSSYKPLYQPHILIAFRKPEGVFVAVRQYSITCKAALAVSYENAMFMFRATPTPYYFHLIFPVPIKFQYVL